MFASLKHKFKRWPRSKHTQSRITKTCTGIKKTNKPIDAPNLHKHQKTKKKQTTRCIKPAKAPKKKKKLQFPGTMGPLLSSCWNFCFFWCLSMFCEVRVTKPAQAPKKPKKLKFPGTMGPLLSSCWNFWFFWFFWCLCRFGASSGLVFLFFLVPINVLWSQSHQTCTGTKKTKKTKPLDAPNLHRHQKN